MIRDVEIRDRARGLGVDNELIRKDHVLNHVLAAVAESADEIAFRGGTALARVFWPDFRISEDLDFLVEGSLRQATELVSQAVKMAAERTGADLTVEDTHPASDMVRVIVWWGERQLAVDLNRAERPALPIHRRELNLPYSDLSQKPRCGPAGSGGRAASVRYPTGEKEGEKALDIIDRHFAAENAHDVEATLATYTENIVWDDITHPLSPFEGKEAVGSVYSRILDAIPDVRLETVKRLASPDGEFVVDESILTGHVEGSWAGVEGGGAPVRTRILHVFELRDGLIARENAWLNAADVVRQVEDWNATRSPG